MKVLRSNKMFYCMPLAKNFQNPDQNWELKKCKECGRECYDMKITVVQNYLKEFEAIKVCTRCALKEYSKMNSQQ